MQETPRTQQEQLQLDLQAEVDQRGIRVITSGAKVDMNLLKGVTVIKGLTRDNPNHVQQTKGYSPKTTLFYIEDNIHRVDYFLSTMTDTFAMSVKYHKSSMLLKLK